jgi:hypothetical protein
MRTHHLMALALSTSVLHGGAARAMCGGMLPRIPPQATPTVTTQAATLTNSATKVILVRDGDSTAITMSNDFDGDVLEFGLIVPVPTVIKKEQVRLVEPGVFGPFEGMTAPRLDEITDPNPCPQLRASSLEGMDRPPAPSAKSAAASGGGPRASEYGVKVESHFAVGAYDIAILSAKDASKLIEWLRLFHYDVSPKAEAIIGSYLAQNMKFFVTQVDLRKMKREGRTYLQPLQVTYTAPRFMLPIRLGMVNADGPQELTVFGLSREGRIEPVNYRTASLPTAEPLPPYVRTSFSDVYRSIFEAATAREQMNVVFTEAAMPFFARPVPLQGVRPQGPRPSFDEDDIPRPHAPGAAPMVPLTAQALRDAGVRWTGPGFVTRLHFRYDEAHFPEDLVLQTTKDQSTKQTRYQVRIPWRGSPDQCPQAKTYLDALPARQEAEVQTLASLTGQAPETIRAAAGLQAPTTSAPPTTTDPTTEPTTEPVTQPVEPESPWWHFWE